ncbi:MAG: hypothetical protein PHQ11_11645 [Paludibacter sp.]|nr:hypothetical protein [Paludibacter sp.]MDD4429166.1 hypothetical protein [Paludibacter sp.]
MTRNKRNIHSFKRGYSLIPYKDLKNVKNEIMDALSITSRSQWYERLWGNVVPNVEEKAAIEQVFMKYRIKKTEIWGN